MHPTIVDHGGFEVHNGVDNLLIFGDYSDAMWVGGRWCRSCFIRHFYSKSSWDGVGRWVVGGWDELIWDDVSKCDFDVLMFW